MYIHDLRIFKHAYLLEYPSVVAMMLALLCKYFISYIYLQEICSHSDLFGSHNAGLAMGLEHWCYLVLRASTAEELEGVLHLSQPNQTKDCKPH